MPHSGFSLSPVASHTGPATKLPLQALDALGQQLSSAGSVLQKHAAVARPCCCPLAALSPRSVTGSQGGTKRLGKMLPAVTTLHAKLCCCRNADVKLCLGSFARVNLFPTEPLVPAHG